MGRRKIYWRKRPLSCLPGNRVTGTGRCGFGKNPNSGKGQVVTEPAGERKRDLVTKWKE